MQLAIIIVNYKVPYFLEQCLYSVMRAAEGLDVTVVVVDNASGDGGVEYLEPLFPSVQFIKNEENLGFAKANNLALRRLESRFVLFLNPDTIIAEDSLRVMLDFIKTDAAIGAIGVRMVDGKGIFLPESKRSFPSPWVSFTKLSGLAAVFPKSRLFNKYALGYLNEHQNHDVDVLAGACMMVRGDLLKRLQGFDESYFLYGEDVDLSHRIRQSGYRNVYFAQTTILHFKGESSRNTTLARVRHFYGAMQVFVQKQYTAGAAKIFSVFLSVAIGLRGMLSAVKKILRPVLLPLLDMTLLWIALQAMRLGWIQWMRHGEDFRVAFTAWAMPLFAIVFVLAAALAGLYERKYKTSRTFAAIAFATICMLAVYSLLPEQVRFSRAVILGGGLMGGGLVFLLRQFFLSGKTGFITSEKESRGQTVIICAKEEYASVLQLFEATMHAHPMGRVSLAEEDNEALCSISGLPSLEKAFFISRIIFCEGTYSWRDLIACAEKLSSPHRRYLFHTIGSASMIGSQTLAPGATVITPDIDYAINHPYQKRMKRLLDVKLGLVLLLLFPLHFLFHRHPVRVLRHCVQVLAGTKTWVSYGGEGIALPALRPGIITPLGKKEFPASALSGRADALYARNYDWWRDFLLIVQNYRSL